MHPRMLRAEDGLAQTKCAPPDTRSVLVYCADYKCPPNVLGDNINQRISLRYLFGVDHSLLVGFDRNRRGIFSLICNKPYLGLRHENLSRKCGANPRKKTTARRKPQPGGIPAGAFRGIG